MDDSAVKHLIEHCERSNIMETTYRHLSDDDHIKAAEEALGLRDEEEDATTLTPRCVRPATDHFLTV